MDRDYSDFWKVTPYDFSIILQGYRERKQIEQADTIAHAWLIEALHRTKGLPKLEKLLEKPKKKMSDDEMMKMCMALNKLFGGEVIKDGN